MFYRYEIKNDGKEDILYLYLTMNYEFSKELSSSTTDEDLKRKANTFIKHNSIDFNGKKIYLVIDGIVVKTLEIEQAKAEEQEISSNQKYDNNSLIILKDNDNQVNQITLKDYLLGVIATNALPKLELTTLKVLCVLYRTYSYKQMQEQRYIKTTNPYQVYKPISYYKLLWLDEYQNYYNKIEKAIDDTNCEFVSYNDEYILPFTHITNNGQTEQREKYPYLKKVVSLWDYTSPYYLSVNDYNYQTLANLLGIDENKLKNMNILDLNEGNHISKIKVGDKIFSGEEFRNRLNLRSTDINIIINPTYVRTITKGWGHNLGLSQFGANEIAKTGCSYVDIIKYYFPNVIVKKYI